MKPEPPDWSNDVTRRQWLLRLGEVIALAGVSGVIPEGAELLFAAGQGQIALPPGLYRPSAAALVHAMRGAHVFTPPAGSETDFAPREDSLCTPHVFSPDE